MSKPEKVAEPSMDEILASIRKIIAEEPAAAKPAELAEPRKQPVAAVTIPAPTPIASGLARPRVSVASAPLSAAPRPIPAPTPAAVVPPPAPPAALAPSPVPAVATPAPVAEAAVAAPTADGDTSLGRLLMEEDLADLVDAPPPPKPVAAAPPAPAPVAAAPVVTPPAPPPAPMAAAAIITAAASVPPRAGGLLNRPRFAGHAQPQSDKPAWPFPKISERADGPGAPPVAAATPVPAAEAPPKPAAKVSAPSVAAHPQKQEPLAEKSEALEVAAVPPTAKSSVVQAPEVVTVKADEAPLISADAPPPISAALPAEPAHVDKPVVPAPVAPPAEAKVVAVASAPAASAAIAGLPVRSLEDTVSELLRPMLREWLDKNMPRIVESALRVEMAGLHKPVEKKPTTV